MKAKIFRETAEEIVRKDMSVKDIANYTKDVYDESGITTITWRAFHLTVMTEVNAILEREVI